MQQLKPEVPMLLVMQKSTKNRGKRKLTNVIPLVYIRTNQIYRTSKVIYNCGQKFKTTFLSTTVLVVTKWNPSTLPDLLSWSLFRTTFFVNSKFQCCFLNCCAILLWRHNKIHRNSGKFQWFCQKGVWPKNCVAQLDLTSIYTQFIFMVSLQNIKTLRKVLLQGKW